MEGRPLAYRGVPGSPDVSLGGEEYRFLKSTPKGKGVSHEPLPMPAFSARGSLFAPCPAFASINDYTLYPASGVPLCFTQRGSLSDTGS